jgi:hypothetical protein
MRLSTYHENVDANGVGKCSVPMWSGGVPGGFCDDVAYGRQEPNQRRYGELDWQRKWIAGYCSGLACYAHGGPSCQTTRSGNAPSSGEKGERLA